MFVFIKGASDERHVNGMLSLISGNVFRSYTSMTSGTSCACSVIRGVQEVNMCLYSQGDSAVCWTVIAARLTRFIYK